METRLGRIVAVAFGWVANDDAPQLIMYTDTVDMIIYRWDNLSGMFLPHEFAHPKAGGMCRHPLNDEIESIGMDQALEMARDLCSYDSNPFEQDFLSILLRKIAPEGHGTDPNLN